jgi:succinate dehydrogenase hydrophobic anchor subunit
MISRYHHLLVCIIKVANTYYICIWITLHLIIGTVHSWISVHSTIMDYKSRNMTDKLLNIIFDFISRLWLIGQELK